MHRRGHRLVGLSSAALLSSSFAQAEKSTTTTTTVTRTTAPLATAGPLRGKTALVTGSTSGIGAAVAEHLCQAGANVVLNGFGPQDEIEAMRSRLERQHDVTVLYEGADMSNGGAIASMFTSVEAKLGPVDILVNNAGVQFVSPVEDFPDEKWDLLIAVNLSASFHTTKAAIAGMKQKGWGRIINIASAHGLVGSPNKTAYCASKHGLVGLTKVLALECAGLGVTANTIWSVPRI